MATSNAFTINSTYGEAVYVYSAVTPTPPSGTSPSTDPADYVPVYTQLGSVDANGSAQIQASSPIVQVIIVRQSDYFPVDATVVDQLDPSTLTISLTPSDETVAESGWTFYQTFASQPYAPVSLNFSNMVETTDPASLESASETFFNANGAPGLTFTMFSAIGYWATNRLYAFPATYYCYEPPAASSSGFILPTNITGMMTIANGTASYTPTGGSAVTLGYATSTLSSAGANKTNGIYLTSIIQDLAWQNKPTEITWSFVGTNDGKQFIAQSYQDPTLPWYAVLYDLTYGAFVTVQIVMAVDAAINMLKAAGQGLQWLSDNISKLRDNIRDAANDTGDTAGPDSAVGDDADPINVDVDVDIDIDVDVDIDIDIDIDVDVDVDIDIDIDVDFVAVVDVDVDVDIDVDIDVVTDTETDIDIDVDVDIDTDVDVDPGGVGKVLNGVGKWIMEKALPTLLEGAVIYVAFQSVGAILNAWKQDDEQDMANLQPRQTTGLGVLINYMFNSQIPVTTRWTAFAEYVQTSSANNETLQINMSSILQTKNTTADTNQANWKWSSSDEQAAVTAMTNAGTGTSAYKAFEALGAYTYQGKSLPLKVGTAVAMKYLKA